MVSLRLLAPLALLPVLVLPPQAGAATTVARPAAPAAPVAQPVTQPVTLPTGVLSTPVADNDALYAQCGRVFPDPQAYGPSPTPAPGESPWAKGNAACRAVDFIQF